MPWIALKIYKYADLDIHQKLGELTFARGLERKTVLSCPLQSNFQYIIKYTCITEDSGYKVRVRTKP